MEQKEYNTPLLDSFEDEEQNNATLPETDTPKHYKDILFLFLFGVNVLSIVGVAFLYGIVALSSDGDEVIKVADNGKQYDQTAEFTPSVSILLGMVSTLLMGVVMTALWIFTLSRVASYVLNAIMISMILVPIIFGFGLFALGFFVFGATLIALSIFLLVFSLFIRPRMDFAATNLKVACASVLQMPSIFGYALLAVGVQVLFCIVWGMAVVGYATSNNQTTIHSHGLIYDLGECTTYVYSNTFDIASYGTLTCAGDTCRACVCDGTFVSNHSCVTPKLYGWTYTWLLLSLFWTSAVISNVVHCTTSAAVAKWWVVGYPSALMVQEGFEAATTTSLGSICLGSLLVAVIRTLRTLLYFASRQMEKKNGRSSGALRQLQSCCVGLLRYLLTVMDRLVVYFNRYALCFVAIYHSDFRTASVSASNLFRTRGWSTLLNDDIIDVVMNIGHVIIGTTSMSTGYIYGRLTGLGHAYTVLLTVFGFVAGYLLSIVALSTISSAVSTVYVCYVDNPHALQISHPEMYVPLSECWQKVFPGSIQSQNNQPHQANNNNDSNKFAEGPAGSVSQEKQVNAPPQISRIRGSFGSLAEQAQTSASSPAGVSSANSGATTASAATTNNNSAGWGGTFSAAGFAILASIFPGPSNQDQNIPISQASRVGTTTTPSIQGGGNNWGFKNVSVAGGGYASLPTSDPNPIATQTFPVNRNGPWSAQGFQPSPQQHLQPPLQQQGPVPPQQHQQQQMPQQQQALPARAPTQIYFAQGSNQPPQQQHHHPHHHHGPGQGQGQGQGEPMFSPQFASAINAIGAFTHTLSNSVFGAGTGATTAGGNLFSPRQQQGQQGQEFAGYPYPSQADNNGGTPSASLMSVDLEESFAV